jgi:hypothetical protein
MSYVSPTLRRMLVPALAALAGTVALLVFGAAPAAASPCGRTVLKDWLDNSRIDRTYELHCYQDAIDSVPIDIRDYSNAVDVISQALRKAGGRKLALSHKGDPREKPEAPNDAVSTTASPSAFPVPLLVLGGVAAALIVAGGAGYVARRRRVDE